MDGATIAMAAAAERPREDATARLATLFDLHHQRLYRLARRLSGCGEEARDLVQETFLRAARSPESIPDAIPNQEAWLVRVLVNISRDRWRRIAVHRHGVLTGRVGRGAAPADPEPALMARSMVQQALAQLPPRRRAILVLYELEGAAIPRIAALLGVSAVTVRWHLSVGRREMARALGLNRSEAEGRS